MAAIKAIWTVLNLAPTAALKTLEAAGAGERLTRIGYWSGWTLDWCVPGIPAGSALVIIIAGLVVIVKRLRKAK